MPIRGETIGHAYVKVHADGSGFDDEVEDWFDKAQPKFKEAGEESGESFNEGWNAKFREGLKQMDKDFANQNRGFRSQLTKNTKVINRQLEDLTEGFEDWQHQIYLVNRDIDRLDREIDQWSVSTSKSVKRVQLDFRKLREEVRELNDSTHNISVTLSRAFGKGSRNNFLNFVGSFVGGIGSIVTGFTRFLTGTSEVGVRIGELISKLGDAESGFGKFGAAIARFAGRGGGGAAGAIPVGAIALPVILAGIGHAIGIMASAITGVIGIIAAFASSITYGLIGSLAGVIGVIVPLVAAIGTIGLAIANLSKEQKAALKPVGDAFKDLGKAAAESFGDHLVKNADEFADILKGMEPIVRRVGNAAGRVLDGFIEDIQSPQFDSFRKEFGEFLPNAVETLGNALSKFAQGMAGVFQAMIPLAEEFLGWLSGIATEFSDWANSAKGQTAMKKFFDDAAESAAALGDFLRAVVEALGAIFEAGKDTGDSFFTSIADTLDEFTKWANSGAGQKSMQEFFDFVQDLGEDIGELIVKVIELVDALDTPRTRKNLLLVLGAINNIIGATTFLIEKWNEFGEGLDRVRVIAGRIAGRFAGIGGEIAKNFSGLAGKILKEVGPVDLFQKFKIPTPAKIAAKFVGTAKQIIDRIGDADLWKVFTFPALTTIAAKFVGLGESIIKKAGDANLIDVFNFPSLQDIADKFSGLGQMISDAVGTISLKFDFPEPPGWLSKAAGIVTASGGIFAGAQTRIIGEAGPEAVVPLSRPLSMVDPAVRELSAIAQGLRPPPDSGQVEKSPYNITIVTPTKDPYAVALETVNRLTAVGY